MTTVSRLDIGKSPSTYRAPNDTSRAAARRMPLSRVETAGYRETRLRRREGETRLNPRANGAISNNQHSAALQNYSLQFHGMLQTSTQPLIGDIASSSAPPHTCCGSCHATPTPLTLYSAGATSATPTPEPKPRTTLELRPGLGIAPGPEQRRAQKTAQSREHPPPQATGDQMRCADSQGRVEGGTERLAGWRE